MLTKVSYWSSPIYSTFGSDSSESFLSMNLSTCFLNIGIIPASAISSGSSFHKLTTLCENLAPWVPFKSFPSESSPSYFESIPSSFRLSYSVKRTVVIYLICVLHHFTNFCNVTPQPPGKFPQLWISRHWEHSRLSLINVCPFIGLSGLARPLYDFLLLSLDIKKTGRDKFERSGLCLPPQILVTGISIHP